MYHWEKAVTKCNHQLSPAVRCTLISEVLKRANTCLRTNKIRHTERALLSSRATWMYHHLPNRSLLRNNRAGLSPSLFSNRHCCNRRQDAAVLRLRALGQSSQVSLLCHAPALGPWVHQALCASGSYLQNRKWQDLPHEVTVRTKVVSVANT